MSDETVKFLLDETEIPTAVAEHSRRTARRAAASAAPRDEGARRPAGPRRPVPDGADRTGGLAGTVHRHPRAGTRRLPAVAPDAALPRTAAGARARYSGAHLLQVRGRLARRLAQAQHRRAAGVRERPGGNQEADDRDRRRPVGFVARLRLQPVRTRVRGLHGRLELRPEALPPLDDADLGRRGAPLAEHADRGGPGSRSTRPVRSASRSPRRSRSPPSARHELRARVGAEPRTAAPDGHRPGGDQQLEMAGEAPDVVVACVGGGSNFGGLVFPFVRDVLQGRSNAVRRGRAVGVPDAHARRVQLRLR